MLTLNLYSTVNLIKQLSDNDMDSCFYVYNSPTVKFLDYNLHGAYHQIINLTFYKPQFCQSFPCFKLTKSGYISFYTEVSFILLWLIFHILQKISPSRNTGSYP